MPSLNKVFLAGNLTRDPELRYTPGGTAVVQFGMAVNRRFRNREGVMQEEATFINVEVWARQAESANEYLSKGSPVLLEGRLKFDSWESKQTGEKRSKLKVVGERIQFLGSRSGARGGERGRDTDGERPSGRPSRAPGSNGRSTPPSGRGDGGRGYGGPPEGDRRGGHHEEEGRRADEPQEGGPDVGGSQVGGPEAGGSQAGGSQEGGSQDDGLPPDNEIPF